MVASSTLQLLLRTQHPHMRVRLLLLLRTPAQLQHQLHTALEITQLQQQLQELNPSKQMGSQHRMRLLHSQVLLTCLSLLSFVRQTYASDNEMMICSCAWHLTSWLMVLR